MTTKKKATVVEKAVAIEPTTMTGGIGAPEPTETAYDMIYDSGSKKYIKVTIKYSLDSGVGTVVSKEEITGNQAVAIVTINNTFMEKMIRTKAKKK